MHKAHLLGSVRAASRRDSDPGHRPCAIELRSTRHGSCTVCTSARPGMEWARRAGSMQRRKSARRTCRFAQSSRCEATGADMRDHDLKRTAGKGRQCDSVKNRARGTTGAPRSQRPVTDRTAVSRVRSVKLVFWWQWLPSASARVWPVKTRQERAFECGYVPKPLWTNLGGGVRGLT